MSTADIARFNNAIDLLDALNREDQNTEISGDKTYPKELLYAYRMSEMLKRYADNPSEALQLAARCQHIQRWKIPRADYPMTKAGYHQWRNQLKSFHAEIARKVLDEVGYNQPTIEQVCSLVRKESHFPEEAQILEDIIVLVFLESYLEPFIVSHSHYEESKLKDILIKTIRKTSKKARSSFFTIIDIPNQFIPIVKDVIESNP